MFKKNIIDEFNKIHNKYPLDGNLSVVKLDEIRKAYDEIKNLRDQYKNENIDKSILAKKIVDRLQYVKYLVFSIEAEITNVEEIYDDSYKCITDVINFLNNSLMLANSKINRYAIKVFYATDDPLKIDYTSNLSKYTWIYVMSDKEALNKLNSQKIYLKDEFTNEFNKLLKDKHSSVITTRNGNSVSVNVDTTDDEMKKYYFLTDGDYSNIECYLFSDALASSMDILKKAFEKDDIEVDKLDFDLLCSRIKNYKRK